ncbi:MAG: Ig-like domain-containing protein, partial [Myxococcota bacterium]
MDPPNGTEVVAQIQLGAVANDEGEVMEAPGFGDIAGTVFRADGTPLSNPSEVVINTGMVRIVTTSAPDGTFSAELVPEGAFRIDVFEPATARTGDTSGRVTREQTTVADVTLVGLGSVSGTVFVNDGSSPVSAASITLFPSGNFTAPLVTTADVQGSYRLPGVPIGPYTVSAQDFISGLRGSADGEVFADGEELGTDVFLDASGSITGTVYAAGTLFGSDGAPLEADGVTPCSSSCFVASANVTFNGPEERVVQTGPDGRFDSGLFLPLGEYSVVTRVPAGGQGSRDRVTLSFEGDSPDLAVVLGGFGTVEGVVLDSTGTNPVDLAQVTLRSSNGFSRGELATQTDADGRFAFSEVSVGSFVLNASKTVQGVPLGASKTGELNSDGEVVLLEGENAVVLEQTARVRVRVLLSDGGTAAAGSVVTARGANVVVSVVADENGDVEFSALRLGSYQFEFRDSASNGVASRSVTLATNGETRDLGEIVLDETPPEVVLVDPPANSANVDPNTAIELTFSEQIRESTVDTIEVTRGGVPVAGAFAVIPDPLVPERSRVVFTPSAPLPDLALITVRVPGEERSFDNELVSVGVTDLEGIGLDSDFVSSFATGDTTSPNVV